MRRFLFAMTVISVSAGLLLGLSLITLQLSSPTGNVGDEGIIAIPVLLLLFFSAPVAAITAIIYLILKRPKGKQTILPIVALLVPILGLISVQTYGSFQHQNGVIEAGEAIKLVRKCEVTSIQGANHKRYKLIFANNRSDDVYIVTEDRERVAAELRTSESACAKTAR